MENDRWCQLLHTFTTPLSEYIKYQPWARTVQYEHHDSAETHSGVWEWKMTHKNSIPVVDYHATSYIKQFEHVQWTEKICPALTLPHSTRKSPPFL